MLAFPSIDWKNVIPWLRRAWWIGWVAPLIIIYILLVYYLDYTNLNQYYGAVLQALGGGFVLFAIDKNLNIFRNTSIWDLIINWARDFPIKKNTNKQCHRNAITSSRRRLSSMRGYITNCSECPHK